jgi:enoyl-CoA hydratase
MTDTDRAVLTERRGHVLLVRLNRKDARNAVNAALAAGVEAAIDELDGDDDLWVGVLAGDGPVFCAGADLKAVSAGEGASLSTERGGFGGLVRRSRKKPLIAAVHGDALAGGFELALACDLIVAGEGVRFGLPEVKRSLLAAAGGLVHLPRLVGEKLALELAMTGDPMVAERLYQLGAINRVVPRETVLEEALALAAVLCANAPLAVRAAREVIVGGRDTDEQARWQASFDGFQGLAKTEDFKEGPRAFIEKRAPVWKGRLRFRLRRAALACGRQFACGGLISPAAGHSCRPLAGRCAR